MAWRSSESESSSTAEAKKKIGAVLLLSATTGAPSSNSRGAPLEG